MKYLILLSCALLVGCPKESNSPLMKTWKSRVMYASVENQGKHYIIGGWDGKNLYNGVWTYSDSGLKYIGQAPWEPRCYFCAVSFHEEIYIFGGYHYGEPSHVYGDIWKSKDGAVWELLTTNPSWEAREHYGVVVFNDKIFLFGGVTYLNPVPPNSLRAFSDVWCSDDGLNWTCVNFRAPWGERRGFSFGVKAGYIWLWGGWDSADNLYNDVWKSKDGATWELVANTTPWRPRGNCYGCVWQDKLWVFGGCVSKDVETCNDVWCSEDGIIWERKEDMPVALAGQNPIIYPDKIVIIGGFSYVPETVFYDDCFVYDGRWR
ncbi:MAG: hypothetical protein DRI56_03165 [Chloroflexota bacterium]|nr:MAG: hypothetical protein DRI56_03165 [Chloroflexota bacterium]